MHLHSAACRLLCASVALSLGGCSINKHTTPSGHDDVSIHTPLGGLDVGHNASPDSLGLPSYPGATRLTGDDGDSANVHMGFGEWQLRVEVLRYSTPDNPDKVASFYRDALHRRYGTVIACRDNAPVGEPTATSEGLTCHDPGREGNIGKVQFDDKDALELRTGTKRHQHIVAVEQSGGGSKLTLLRLDLPHVEGKDAQ